MERRIFVKTSALAIWSICIPDVLQAVSKRKPIGVQLYTLRSLLENDVTGVLRQLAEMGYTVVESYRSDKGHYFGYEAKKFGELLKELGLHCTSMHIPLGKPDLSDHGTLRNGFEKLVEGAASIGQSYLVVPYLEKNERASIDSYKRVCQELNKAGELAAKSGIKLGYHNHAFELETLESEIPYDVMLRECDPKYVDFEMDIYWVVKAGKEPLVYFKNHPGRFPLWHVKDMDNTPEHAFTEVGNGIIPFKDLFKKAGEAGLVQYFVEQDKCPGSPLDSVRKSIEYINKNKF